MYEGRPARSKALAEVIQSPLILGGELRVESRLYFVDTSGHTVLQGSWHTTNKPIIHI